MEFDEKLFGATLAKQNLLLFLGKLMVDKQPLVGALVIEPIENVPYLTR